MTEGKYKFDINLLQLSNSKDINIAKTEWFEVYREYRKEYTGLCICQHTLKNIIYMYNKFTKYTISVGVGCCKKFNLQPVKINNTILQNVLKNMLIKGEYKIINNILEYTQNIEIELINYITNKYKNILNVIDKLKELNKDIINLINEYDLKYLQDEYERILYYIIILEKAESLKEKERIKIEQIDKERIENEKIKIEQIEKERIENEKIEQINKMESKHILIMEREHIRNEKIKKAHERKQLYHCICTMETVCICETPNYELVKISNNLYCINCNKWKCRCNKILKNSDN